MKNLIKTWRYFRLLSIILLFSIIFIRVYAANISITSSMNWSAITTGSGPGGLPNSTDNITVSNFATLTVNTTSSSCASMILGVKNAGDGTLTFALSGNPSLSISGNLTFGHVSPGTASSGVAYLTMVSGATLSAGSFVVVGGVGGYTPGGTVIFTGTNTLDPVFNAFNNLIINGGATTIGAATTLTGDLNIITGNFSTSGSNYALNIAGNFTETGTLTIGSSTVSLNGASQTINGNGPTFYNLVINATTGVTLTCPAYVNNILTLTNGIVTTSSANLLTLALSASVSGGGTLSYISGPVANTWNGIANSKTYPIGKNGIYRPVTLSINNPTSPVISVEMFNSNSGGSAGSGLDKISEVRYYQATLISGSAVNGGTATLSYGSDDGVTTPSNLVVAQSSTQSGTYNTLGQSAVNGSFVTSTVNAYYPANGAYLLLGSTGGNPLPVELMYFKASLVTGSVLLNWATASETNNSHFEIQRSENGLLFTPLASVQGAGNSYKIINYSFTDDYLAYNTMYYRLKQVDFNGNFTYSNIAAVSMGYNAGSLVVYPNPAEASDLHIVFPSGVHSNVNVQVCDINGKCVYTKFAYVEGSTMNLDLNSASVIKTGLYVLIINSDEQLFRQTISLK
jgi:hypothetical protein